MVKAWNRFQRIGVVVLIAAAFFAWGITPVTQYVLAQESDLTEVEKTLARVYQRIGPSVVSINVDQQNRAGAYFPWSSGSGFVFDKLGHIITNYHVIENGDRIVVNFFDGTIVRAEFVGYDPDSDIAVLKVDLLEERLIPVSFGDSDSLVIGQTALAIGSPFGQQWTLTSGIISALNRAIDGMSQFPTGSVIQTDTPINPGNSGGPLLNLKGEVIGVNSQIYSISRINSGVGFAVPSNLVQRVVTELIEHGEVNYSYLGISGEDVNLDYMEALQLPNNLRGVVVTQVRNNTPAALAGLNERAYGVQDGQRQLQHADIIVALDGQPVIGFSALLGYLASYTYPGQVITITVLRDGVLIDLEVTLEARSSR
jgi:S1-C subfamily serine protease